MSDAPLFRFDKDEHEYIHLASGRVLPHITGMLTRMGLVDDRWFTDESRDRGHAVHALTAHYDLGAIEDARHLTRSVYAPYSGWLQAHVKARSMIQPLNMLAVEEPEVHPHYLYGGRPDRLVLIYGLKAVLELKSGPPEKAHLIQTALQAILIAPTVQLPPERVARFCLYLKSNGKFVLEQHTNQGDFLEAQRVIRACC